MADLDRDLEQVVSRMVADSGAVRDAARRVEARAKTLAAGHGDLAAHIDSMPINRTDWYVALSIPFAGHVEFGHTLSGWAAPGWGDEEDAAFFGVKSHRRVPGLHIMTRAAQEA